MRRTRNFLKYSKYLAADVLYTDSLCTFLVPRLSSARMPVRNAMKHMHIYARMFYNITWRIVPFKFMIVCYYSSRTLMYIACNIMFRKWQQVIEAPRVPFSTRKYSFSFTRLMRVRPTLVHRGF